MVKMEPLRTKLLSSLALAFIFTIQTCPLFTIKTAFACFPIFSSQRSWIPCNVPRTPHVMQFINGSAVRDISDYNGDTLPDGTWLVGRCKHPGRYRLVGESRRLCTEGEWSAPEPTCVSVPTTINYAGIPHVLASNGTIIIYPRPRPATIRHQKITCKLGGDLQGSAKLTVPHNVNHVKKQIKRTNRWGHSGQITREFIYVHPILPEHSGNYSCSTSDSNEPSHTVEIIIEDITCPVPVHPANGIFIDRDNAWPRGHYTVAKRIYFECNADFLLVGASQVDCTVDGWSKPNPTCIQRPRHPCNVSLTTFGSHVLQFLNGSAVRDISDYNGATLPDGTWLVARCEDPGRYRLVGESRRLCIDGEWSAPEPTCGVDGLEWGEWSQCSRTCGEGDQFRRRVCSDPRMDHQTCRHLMSTLHRKDLIERQLCHENDCEVRGHWGPWGTWQPCALTCGPTTSFKVRNRTCIEVATENEIPDDAVTEGYCEAHKDREVRPCELLPPCPQPEDHMDPHIHHANGPDSPSSFFSVDEYEEQVSTAASSYNSWAED